MLSWPAISGLSVGWLTAGTAAAAIPILIHLWAKRRAPIVLFPAARFARRAVAGARSRRRLRDRALLTLRALALVLLALAFARPLIESPALSGGAIAPGTSLVILLDASASMRRAESGVVLFDAAKERARSMLAECQENRGRAAVILISADPQPLLPRLTENIPHLISAVESARPTLERGDAPRAMTLAESLLKDNPSTGRRVIVVLSDMQRTQWRGLPSMRSSDMDLRFEKVSREEHTGNVALAAMTATPARPIVGTPTTLAATVRNFSDDPRSILVRFTRDGRPIGESVVHTPAWSEREAIIDARFDAPGDNRVEASIAPEEFQWDDEATATIAITDWPRVAFVMNDSAEPRSGSTDWFIRAALTASSGLPPTMLHASEPAASALDAFDTIVIAEGVSLTEPHHEALRTFAERGGVVLRFVGPNTGAPGLAEARPRENVLWPLTPLQPDGSTDRSPHLRAVPGSAILEDNPLLASVLRACDGLEAAAATRTQLTPGATALLESDQGPVVASQTVGGGATLLVALDLDPSRSQLLRSPLFPALIHALLESERTASRGANAGIHLDPAESDLRSLAVDESRSLSGAAPVATSADDDGARQFGSKRPIETWPWLLVATLGFLSAEGWLRQRHASSGGRA